jgi:hypothetical protein
MWKIRGKPGARYVRGRLPEAQFLLVRHPSTEFPPSTSFFHPLPHKPLPHKPFYKRHLLKEKANAVPSTSSQADF